MTSTTQTIIALAIKHGASSYTNRADTQHPAYGFTEAALTAFAQDLLAGQCLHQIAEPAQAARTEFEAVSRFMKCEWNLDWDPAGFYDDAKTDAAFTWFEQGYMRAQQAAAPLAAVHPDDAAVDALAVLMKAKLAEKRAKGYGGWNDQTQCPQQRLSDMLRAQVYKGDPVDVANFCAMLSARGEGIAAAPQAVQAAVPLPMVELFGVKDGQETSLGPVPMPPTMRARELLQDIGFRGLDDDDGDGAYAMAACEQLIEYCKAYYEAPAHPAEGAPAPEALEAVTKAILFEDCGSTEDWEENTNLGLAAIRALAATQPAAQGMDAGDKELLDFLQAESLDLLCFARPTGGDDADIGWRTVQHHMGQPSERIASEVYDDDPRRAIREAMARLKRDPYCTGPLHEDDAALAAQAKQGGDHG